MKAYFIFLLITLALFSCSKEDIPVQNENTELIGSWINPQYSDTLVTYTRAETLVENQYGITFENMGKLNLFSGKIVAGVAPLRLQRLIMKVHGLR